MTQKIGVFVPQETDTLFHFHFNKCWITHLVEVYNDLDSFKSSGHVKKIACLQMPYPMNPTFDSLVKTLLPDCDNLLILMSELHDSTVEFIQHHDHRQISYFICGDLNFELANSAIHKFYDWFTTSVHFYKHERPKLLANTLSPYTVKPKMFDALLGRKKHHRDVAYRTLDKQTNIVTYFDAHECNFSSTAHWRWEDVGMVKEGPINWTVDKVNYHGCRLSLSQIIPLEVYNETAYSLIAETNYSSHYSFYTEKTVKPILGQRLFVMLSGQYSLRNLRNIGFRTFDTVIDESYDDCDLQEIRFQSALDQVKYLTTEPQESILEKIRPICEHNYSHMMRTDWYGEYFMPAFVAYFLQT